MIGHTNFDAGFGLPSTAGSQLEQDYGRVKADLDEALSILQEAVRPEIKPWLPPWKGRARRLLERLGLG